MFGTLFRMKNLENLELFQNSSLEHLGKSLRKKGMTLFVPCIEFGLQCILVWGNHASRRRAEIQDDFNL